MTPTPRAFTGFGPRTVGFFEGLAADNTAQYWRRHLAVYDGDVRAPMQALVAALEHEFGAARIFRPQRDQRFSRDGAAYKTYCAAVVTSYYCQVSAAGLMVGEGVDQATAEISDRYRRAVDDERTGPELTRIVAKLVASGWSVQGKQLKTAPRGFSRDHPRLELLRYRALWVTRQWPPDAVLYSRACLARVQSAFRALTPLYQWLSTHVFLGHPACRP